MFGSPKCGCRLRFALVRIEISLTSSFSSIRDREFLANTTTFRSRSRIARSYPADIYIVQPFPNQYPRWFGRYASPKSQLFKVVYHGSRSYSTILEPAGSRFTLWEPMGEVILEARCTSFWLEPPWSFWLDPSSIISPLSSTSFQHLQRGFPRGFSSSAPRISCRSVRKLRTWQLQISACPFERSLVTLKLSSYDLILVIASLCFLLNHPSSKAFNSQTLFL